jgi:hypothetical protein
MDLGSTQNSTNICLKGDLLTYLLGTLLWELLPHPHPPTLPKPHCLFFLSFFFWGFFNEKKIVCFFYFWDCVFLNFNGFFCFCFCFFFVFLFFWVFFGEWGFSFFYFFIFYFLFFSLSFLLCVCVCVFVCVCGISLWPVSFLPPSFQSPSYLLGDLGARSKAIFVSFVSTQLGTRLLLNYFLVATEILLDSLFQNKFVVSSTHF